MYDESIPQNARRQLCGGPYGKLISECGYSETLTADVLANVNAALVLARDEGIIDDVDFLAAETVMDSLKWEQYTP